MSHRLRVAGAAILLAAAALVVGCGPGKRESATPASTEAAEAPGEGHHHAHGEEDEATAGASFDPRKGILLGQETRTNLGVRLAEVEELALPAETRFTAQVFGERHHHLPTLADHSGCDVHGSGLVPDTVAATIAKGDRVSVLHPKHGALHGVVLTVQKAVALGESEVIIGISNAVAVLRPGEFVPSLILHPTEQPTATVPSEAVLRTAEGAFVYTVNGDAFLRTVVRTGATSGGRIAITDGLLPGDQVVAHPAEALWLIELRATKGGGHSH